MFIDLYSAQEWCEITIQSSRYKGGDCASANLLRFEHTSKYHILILGGWQDGDVIKDMWLGTNHEDTIWKFDQKKITNVSS